MKYYAHSSEKSEKEWQTMVQHLTATAERAAKNASKIAAQDFGYACGLLHDLGKYSQDFQEKLKGKNIRVDHSTAGAREAVSIFGDIFGRLLAYCIAGHHNGLLDYGSIVNTEGTLCSRLKNADIKNYSAYKNELNYSQLKPFTNLPLTQIKGHESFTISFFIRFLFSCLVDADFIDTETYMCDEARQRGENKSIIELCGVLNEFLENLICENTKINTKRKEILTRCISKSNNKPGLYSLTVPTGGGKTYSSLAFALNHAVKNKLERIIYVIPYTSIIEQNARVFKDILGEENVLEHHSNFQYESRDSEQIQLINERLKLASENWDISIVVTTNVQFFESIFSNKSSKCRKIHNLAKSVIIFDEAQMLPFQYLKPCIMAISELAQNYGSTVVLCTATQPSISEMFTEPIKPIEIIENPYELYNDFKKVEVINIGELNDLELVWEVNQKEQVLCIVNTRKHAKEIFSILEGEVFHLSTLMCPIHRQETLNEIRKHLKEKQDCKVVSTQLIEAGVDIDFPVVYRAIAGIDSIIQSAGRCNREGKLEKGSVFVFRPCSEYAKVKGYLERTAKVAEMVFREHKDPISLEAIDCYFKMLYELEGKKALDRKGILDYFEERGNFLEFDFQTAAREFKLIESNTYPIVIPYNEEAERLINIARFSKYPLSIARKLQQFTVSVYEYEYKELCKNSAIKMINDNFIVLDNVKKNYDKNTCLILPKDTFGEGMFV